MKIAVIGYGSFGSNVAKTLFAKGHEVLVIDKDKENVAAATEFATNAVVSDSAAKENLEALGLADMDVVVVSLGHEMESSILTTLYLREIGVKKILAKAMSEDHAKVLEAVGATEVVYPEKDMAVRTALRLSSPISSRICLSATGSPSRRSPLRSGSSGSPSGSSTSSPAMASRSSPSRRSCPTTSSSSPGPTLSSRIPTSSSSSARRRSWPSSLDTGGMMGEEIEPPCSEHPT